MATFTQMGTIVNQPATMSSSSDPNMQAKVSAYAGDSYVSISLPFSLQFFDQLITTWYVGSNSYITYSGQTNYTPSPTMDYGVYILAKDNSYDYVGYLSSQDGNSFTVHFEGNAQNTDGTNDLWWDCTFFKDGVIQIVLDSTHINIVAGSSYSCISNGFYGTEIDFTPVAGQSYVLIPNSDFSLYTVQTGVSYSYAPVVNNYAPTVPTSLSSSISGTTATISGIVHDQDGGTNQLVVDYSTDQTFTTGVVTVLSSGINVESSGNVVISGLNPNTTYYFRVRGYDGTNYSNYSSTMNFTTANVIYPTLSNFGPATQSTYSTSGTMLSVIPTSSQGLSMNVTFQVSTDKTFATGVTTLTATGVSSGATASKATGTLNAGSVYYWRVQAIDSNNNSSAWSRIFVLYTQGTGTQKLSPDAIVTQTNLTGALSTITDDPNSPDTTFMTTTTSGTNTTLVTSFPTPTNTPLVDGPSQQTIYVYAKRTNTNGTPTMTISILENGTTIATSSAISVSSTTGATSTFAWDATGLTDQTGAGVQVEIDTTAYKGGSKKTDISIGAVQWIADVNQTPATVSDPNPADTTAPSDVSSLRTTNVGQTTVDLSWINPSDSDYSYCNVYRNNVLLGTSLDGTYADSGLTIDISYTYKVTTVDQAGNESNGATLGVLTGTDPNPPLIASLTASRTKIGAIAISDDNKSTVTFTFDSNIGPYLININGTSYDSGTTIASGGAKKVSQVAGETVSLVSSEKVGDLAMIASGNTITVVIDNSEIPGGEGAYQINIYGQGKTNNKWTPYMSS